MHRAQICGGNKSQQLCFVCVPPSEGKKCKRKDKLELSRLFADTAKARQCTELTEKHLLNANILQEWVVVG